MLNLVKDLLIKEMCSMKRLISTVTAFMMIFTLALILPEGAIRAGAISGTGAKADPYVVSTFDELNSIFNPESHTFTKDTDIYIRLSKDISKIDNNQMMYFKLYSNSTGIVNYHLDLAGHTLYRESEYCRYLFMISSNSCLTVYDSVGGGKIETKIQPYNMHPNTFFVMGGGDLVIENGIFISNNTKTEGYVEEYIDCYGGTVTINGGTFYSYYRPIHQSSGDVIINDATFYVYGTHPERTYPGLEFNDKTSKVMIYNCTLIGVDDVVHISAPELMQDILPEKYTLMADGVEKEVTDFETYSGKPTNIYGRKLIIKSPEKIERVDITLPEPKAGEKPDNTAAVTKGEAKVTLVQWTENNLLADTFEEGKTYNARLVLSPLEGYTFSENTKVYFNGKQAEVWALMPIFGGYKGNVIYTLDLDCKGAKLLGDADDSGEVTVDDVLLIQQKIAGWDVEINFANADADGDGNLSVSDALIVQQIIAGWKIGG